MRVSHLLRPACLEDAEALARLFVESRLTFVFLNWTYHLPEILRLFQELVLPKHEVWVAEQNGAITGFIALEGNDLDRLYVRPSYQGLGVGRALLDKAKELRPSGMELWVFQENRQARRFYERNGFTLLFETDGRDNMEKCPDARYAWKPNL